MNINVDKVNNKEVVKAVKETIKELQKDHKQNLKYRPYPQDIRYAMIKKGSYVLNVTEIQEIILTNKIKIEQPKDPINDPQSPKLSLTK